MPRPDGPRTTALRLEVVATSWLSPHLRRVELGGDAVAEVAARDRGRTDRYVKMQFPRPGVTYPEPLDLSVVRSTMPPEEWPVQRTYTLRAIDRERGRLVVDMVVHGDTGVAGPWARDVAVGEPAYLLGPGGAYAPSPEADWHLVAGDEAALPAVASALEAMPPGATVRAFVEVDSAADHVDLPSPADVDLVWLHRDGAPAGTTSLIPDAVRAVDWLPGRVQVFVHGESGLIRALRRWLLDQGVERDDLSLSGYWRTGETEEGFRRWKSEQAEPAGPATGRS